MTLDKIAESIIFHGKIPVSFFVTLTGKEAEIASYYDQVIDKHPLIHKVGEALKPFGVSVSAYSFYLESTLHNGKITYFACYNDGGK